VYNDSYVNQLGKIIMKLGKLKVGDKVVFNDLEDAQIFDVLSIDGHRIEVSYKMLDGEYVKSSWSDCSLASYPSKKQLAYKD
jgi:hypothetical protein